MTETTIFYIILFLFTGEFILSKILDYLNTKNWTNKLPEELKEIYNEEKYEKSMEYERTKYKFSSITGTFSFFIIFLVLSLGGFGFLDSLVRTWTNSYILTGLYFFGIIALIQSIISLPISYYSNFVIEEKFGFNKMTKKIFFIDIIKSFILTIIIGGLLLSLIIWLYTLSEDNFWIYAWLVSILFSIFMMMFYSSIIVPIFNKQYPLEKGELRSKIEEFSDKVGFNLDNIFVIDGSKRSSKSNAYFSGFGPKKRIVLYDTLIKDLDVEELVSVLAHEIGHYKRKHTLFMLVFSIIQIGIMLFVLGISLKLPEISIALGAGESSFWIGAVAFGILFTPISIIFGLLGNILSRKNEYEADEFAGINYKPEKLKMALVKLSRNNLSNLKPHPIYEFFHYSHPNVLKRLKALSNIKK